MMFKLFADCKVDVVILETEVQTQSRAIGKNPFSLMVDLFQTLLNQVEKHDITIGKLSAKNKDVKLLKNHGKRRNKRSNCDRNRSKSNNRKTVIRSYKHEFATKARGRKYRDQNGTQTSEVQID